MHTPASFARMRGFNGYSAVSPLTDHWAEMRKLGATLVRLWYTATLGPKGYSVSGEQRQRMQDAVAGALRVGLTPVLCVGCNVADMPLGSAERARAFAELWQSLQRAHQHQPLAAFDLLNEPMPPEGFDLVTHFSPEQGQRVAAEWRDVAMLVAGALQAREPWRLIVVQQGLGADPAQFVMQRPLPIPTVVHSVHMYLPHEWTHHGVDEARKGLPVPPAKALTREVQGTVHKALAALSAWSDQHRLPIFVGEFSAHNLLPDAHRYVAAVAGHCNARGWPWAYHDWRGWPGWQPSDSTLAVLRAALAGGASETAA